MKINVEPQKEEIIITDDDFFSGFEKPKEVFEQEEPTRPQEKEVNKGTSAPDFMDTEKTQILSKADKEGLSDFFITTVTNYIDDLAGGYSGLEDKGRYMPSAESLREMKKSLSKLIPDKFRMPEWLKLTVLIVIAYTPIIKKAKRDKKNNAKQES